jgi:hypothetical protein
LSHQLVNTSSLGYIISLFLILENILIFNNNKPTLPKSIVAIITIFPATVKPAVIPRDKPTVPKAEVVSKKSLNRLCSAFGCNSVSERVRRKKLNNKTIMAFIVKMTIWKIDCDEILRLKIGIPFLGFIFLNRISIRIKKVVTFTPPEMEPGDPPINIKGTKTICVMGCIRAIVRVLKPAVLGVIE